MDASIFKYFMRVLGVVGPAPKPVTGSRQLDETDNGATLLYTGTTAITITLAKDLPTGFACKVVQGSTGAITIAPTSGVTVGNAGSKLTTGAANALASITQAAANRYVAHGDLSAT